MADTDEDCSLELFECLPDEQRKEVMASGMCDIEPSFMGFVRIYRNLSEIIPKHFTVVDLGCAYAPQCWYFRDHAGYIGVDIGDHHRFHMPNTIHYSMSISDFIRDVRPSIIDPVFAICSYVPPWGEDNMKITQLAFTHAFTYYPDRTPRIAPPTPSNKDS